MRKKENMLKIISYLRRNARMPKVRIAEELGVTETAVRKRIKRLEEHGIILGYRAIIDYRKIGMVCSYTGIDVEPETLLSIVRKLRENKQITSLYLTSGDHDLLVEIIANNINELEKIHDEISRINGVKRICPAIITEVIILK